MLESEPDVGFVGHTLELPGVMADGPSVQRCVTNILEATTFAIATLIEQGERVPAPAREMRRDQQINIRLTIEERTRLDGLAQSHGYSSVSDYIRATALRAS